MAPQEFHRIVCQAGIAEQFKDWIYSNAWVGAAQVALAGEHETELVELA
jgi:hypothetical protein